MKINKEGYRIIAISGLVCLVLWGLLYYFQSHHWETGLLITCGAILVAFWLFIVAFFREPRRVKIHDPELVFSPCDGRVVVTEVVYEDEYLLVLNNEAGMVVHPGHGHFSGTLVNALAHHLGISQGPDAQDERMGVLVHRIDKDTSGLLVVAKNDEAQLNLAKQFFVHSIERRYVAIVWGNLKEDEGTIIGNIGRDPNDRMRFKVFPDGDHGKHAVTHYKVLERFGYVTVVECRLETGRTHQIRVHFNWIGHPLFNDERYDGSEIRKGTIYAKYRQFIENCFKLLPRQALHAKTLGFVHPRTKEMIRLDSKLPDDMQALIDKWRKYAENMVPEE